MFTILDNNNNNNNNNNYANIQYGTGRKQLLAL